MIFKSNLFQMALVCVILSSCVAEESLEQYQYETPVADVLNCQLSLNVPASRGNDNADDFYNLYYAVYEKTTGKLVSANPDNPQKLENSGKCQDVEIPLAMYQDKIYDIALWAHPENACCADVSDLKNILIDYSQGNPIGLTTHFSASSNNTAVMDIVLRNPFSRFQIRSSEKDAQAARNSRYDFTQITATLNLDAVGTSYNALTGAAGTAAKVHFVNDQLENENFGSEGDKLLMDVSFLTIKNTYTTGEFSVMTDENHSILKNTIFEKIFFQSDATYSIEGEYLGYPIDFDITVGDWNVNSQTITFN